MKKLLVLLILLLASTASADDVCWNLKELAYSIMEARQMEIPENLVVDALNTDPNELVKAIGYQYIKQAYASPPYSTEEEKLAAAMVFSMDKYLLCIKSK